MITEPETAMISFPATEADPPPKQGGYELSRFNAVQHGILSRYTVLPHEGEAEYLALLAALVEEHQPRGATEMHLVEELAGCVWRKRRVLMAEGAAIRRGLYDVATDTYHSPAPAAVPFEPGLSSKGDGLRELLSATPEEIAERQRKAKRDLEATEKAAAILRRGGARAYDRALKVLLPDSRSWCRTALTALRKRKTSMRRTPMGSPHLSTTICYRPASVARRKFVTWRPSRRKRLGRDSSPNVWTTWHAMRRTLTASLSARLPCLSS